MGNLYISNASTSTPIISIDWEAAANISEVGEDGDNWSTAWLPSGNLLTAYGDGWGFDPEKSKVSIGLSIISGTPHTHSGENLDSNIERTGDGKFGEKCSGMVSVNGRVWLWLRNAVKSGENAGTECRLCWSDDGGETWTEAGWRMAVGYLTFANYGQDETNPDGYLYSVTPDGISAYGFYDDLILCRAPASTAHLESSWEWYTGLNSGSPVWGTLANAASIVENVGNCQRQGISYIAGLNRYIMYQPTGYLSGTGNDPRYFVKPMWIWEAPQPWGPWTLVDSYDPWDVPPGEHGNFPPKWMSANGLEVYLIFSRNDVFSVRKATLNGVH